MITRLNRLLILVLMPIALAACMNPEPATAQQTAAVPLGFDLGRSGPVTATAPSLPPPQAARAGGANSGHPSSGAMQIAHKGHNDAHGVGTVNSVDPAQHKINVSHEPISEIGWPAMTMDFAVAPNVDLHAIKSGARINFTIEKGQGGMYEIRAITPAGGGK
jgi:Cu(I)/Ag(I) efflux system protein CusF